MVYPLMMTTNPMIMKTISDEDKFPDAENEFYAAVSYDDEDQTCGDDDQFLDAADRFSDVMEDTSSALEKASPVRGTDNPMPVHEECPTGGLYNILSN